MAETNIFICFPERLIVAGPGLPTVDVQTFYPVHKSHTGIQHILKTADVTVILNYSGSGINLCRC